MTISDCINLIFNHRIQIILVFAVLMFFAVFRYVFYKKIELWVDKLQKHIKPIKFTKRVLMFWKWCSSKSAKGLHYRYDFRKKR